MVDRVEAEVKKFQAILKEHFPVTIPDDEMSFMLCVATERDLEGNLTMEVLGSGTNRDQLSMFRKTLKHILKDNKVFGMLSLLNDISGLII